MIKVNDIDMYYEEEGSGPPLILLSGGTAIATSWYPHLPALSSRFRVIMPETRGHGRTNNPAGKLSYSMMADDFAAFASALGLTRPFFFGYSDGGQIGLELAMRHPEVPGGMVLGGATYHFSESYFETVNSFSFITNGQADIEAIQRDDPEWAAELQRDHGLSGDPEKWKDLLTQITPLWLTQLSTTLDDLRKITAPTMLLVGDRDEGVPVEQAVEMYRAIPNSALTVIPNADHGSAGWVNDGPNPLFAGAVVSFFQKLLQQ